MATDKYDAYIIMRVNSKNHAELLAKAIRDTVVSGRPVVLFSAADAARALQTMYCMPELRASEVVE